MHGLRKTTQNTQMYVHGVNPIWNGLFSFIFHYREALSDFLLYWKYMPVNRYVYIDYLSKVWIKFITMACFLKPGTQMQYTHIL